MNRNIADKLKNQLIVKNYLSMVKVFKYGRMVQNTKEIGEMAKQMATEFFTMLTVTFTRVNLKMIKPMVTVLTFTKTVPNFQATGLMI